ncbi:MAG: DNA-processing protein DprA [Spirochaetota bacterium]|nr:DNA-processing protein DprA [Spirochaetota bacterium]
MDIERKKYSIALSIVSSPSYNNVWESINTNTDPIEIYRRIENNSKLSTQSFISVKYQGSPIDAAKSIIEAAIAGSIRIIDLWDKDYPPLLKEISKPPLVLYCKGNFSNNGSISIVGSRKIDTRSSHIARRISSELSEAGYTIVSGMAIGIDREAHLGALQRDGATIGVLANGIDVIYPSYNKDLFSAILSSNNSSIISEYPPGIRAGKWTFVRRNRIISGLSLGTVIVKAGEKSGALITARHALEQNREVFACPGFAFDEAYSGCHNLIRNGAVLVANSQDVLREIQTFNIKNNTLNNNISISGNHRSKSINVNNISPESNDQADQFNDDSIERKILSLLTDGEKDTDSMVRLLNCNPGEVNEGIVMLELSGLIIREGNLVSKL